MQIIIQPPYFFLLLLPSICEKVSPSLSIWINCNTFLYSIEPFKYYVFVEKFNVNEVVENLCLPCVLEERCEVGAILGYIGKETAELCDQSGMGILQSLSWLPVKSSVEVNAMWTELLKEVLWTVMLDEMELRKWEIGVSHVLICVRKQ